ncbi:hypothetical protein HGRIS_003421 [Hohenbuehelia grisea]|uniref:Uncharacterized protein n=1 Tax=Hohenbuehelia grisea TaxID=104357 RepID=A0ABR3JFM9_9AGAR
MANPAAALALADRADIHKSCKSLETLLNILNDYCEAASAIVSLQKRLTKALRETAAHKITGDVAGNALGASAAIFEALSDIDSKFAKLTDKEYDAISAEVKKWFKKLAKEEKAHDERIATANLKIKQAGQAYEKKSKKNPTAAGEEHARYIHLISSLGPEISQDKYNHALQITQRHVATTQNVAACLSRVADAEWLRSCESVRRFAPTVGQLGEWRALCEGGWTGPSPQDLPNVDDSENANAQPSQDRSPQGNNMDPREVRLEPPAPAPQVDESQTSPMPSPITSPRRLPQPRASLASSSSPSIASQQKFPPSSFEPPRPLGDPNTGSVRSLSEFPVPPTHFPIPAMRSSSQTDTSSPPLSHREPARAPSTASNVSFPSMPRLTESPLPDDPMEERAPSYSSREHSNISTSPVQQHSDDRHSEASPSKAESEAQRHVTNPQSSGGRNSAPMSAVPKASYLRGDYFDDRDRDPAAKSNAIERTDTGSNSVVTSLKARYSNGSGASSPPPSKSIPKLPLSVTNLASRYEPGDSPKSALRVRAASPPAARSLSSPTVDMAEYARLTENAWREPSPTMPSSSPGHVATRDHASLASSSTVTPTAEDDAARRRRRADEIAQSELKERERELREREREIQRRADELERERAQLMNARGDMGYAASDSGGRSPVSAGGISPLTARERRISTGGDALQAPSSPASPALRHRPQYSYSTTHLIPPSSASSAYGGSSQTSGPSHGGGGGGGYKQPSGSSQPPSPRVRTSSHVSQSEASEHAAYCGCDRCSASKYRSRSPASPVYGSTADLRPPEKPKPKGWIRRLSMPVGQAFSLDSAKRHNSSNSVSASANANNAGVGSGMFSLDGRHKASSGALRNMNVHEDGRIAAGGGMGVLPSRTSYDSSAGISNRSVTSLGLGGRR